ncbi:alpha/beta fold hydrolase (plasmid) [Roseomonas sp. CCTCC AB2023176]|uniref:alpha/beta fold hydrolase n=1 Tax=Roseomonas sp. CCTCC AB2023176 TaxID=3342640 RepID=UPI0035E1C47A
MPAMRHVASGRAALAAEAVGEGQPVAFHHSNAGDRREWHGPMGRLGAAHRAVAYDRRGFGATRAEREDHPAVADLLAVLDAVTDGTPAVLVGCSMGGKIALDAALRHPARVRGLVLIAPSVERRGSARAGLPARDRGAGRGHAMGRSWIHARAFSAQSGSYPAAAK